MQTRVTTTRYSMNKARRGPATNGQLSCQTWTAHPSIYIFSQSRSRRVVSLAPKNITIVPARGAQAETMSHHHNPFPICQKVAEWEDCQRSLHSPADKIRHGYSRGKAAGFLVVFGPSALGEVRREHPSHREFAAPIRH